MTRLDLCYRSLQGLSVGDALGAQFFVPGRSLDELRAGRPPAGPWEWTDDTEMACSVVTELRDHGEILPDRLARLFADRCEPYRGYGGGAVAILHEIRDGRPWRDAAGAAFDGQGSCGNGAAMRVAPLGAYFSGDLRTAGAQAIRSAEVTHAHPEGIIGAVAVAVAAATAPGVHGGELLDAVRPYLVESQVERGIRRAAGLLGRPVAEAAYELGNGARTTAQDTVPFALWVAATYPDDYRAAITACIEAGGDVDTTAAIVGGIVGVHTEIPPSWVTSREPLPGWVDQP